MLYKTHCLNKSLHLKPENDIIINKQNIKFYQVNKAEAMTQYQINIFGIVELLTFFFIICLIIGTNIYVNRLRQEVNELHLYLPDAIKDIKNDLRSLNAELSEYTSNSLITPDKIGFIVGQIITEIILLKFKTMKLGKKFIVFSMIFKAFNINKWLKPLLLLKNIR